MKKLYVGLGGIGCRTLRMFEKEQKASDSARFLYLDSDVFTGADLPSDSFFCFDNEKLNKLNFEWVTEKYFSNDYFDADKIELIFVTSSFGDFGSKNLFEIANFISSTILTSNLCRQFSASIKSLVFSHENFCSFFSKTENKINELHTVQFLTDCSKRVVKNLNGTSTIDSFTYNYVDIFLITDPEADEEKLFKLLSLKNAELKKMDCSERLLNAILKEPPVIEMKSKGSAKTMENIITGVPSASDEEIAEIFDFKNLLLLCAPVQLCMEYRAKIEKFIKSEDCISINYDTFIDELIDSVYNKSSKDFRQKYTLCKVLIFNDIQFVTGKENTQETLYHIIKTRINNNMKTIVISARSANNLSKLLFKEFYELLTVDVVKDDFLRLNNHCHPYAGDKTYIFVSYAHKNSENVLEIIERLQKDGYRIWYDEGIDPGSEWDEYIAKKIEESDYFIAFLSEEYMESKNCRDELNYARDLDKDRLLVYLSDIKLTGGMAMRLNRLQAIHKYTYSSLDSFIKKLESTSTLDNFNENIE